MSGTAHSDSCPANARARLAALFDGSWGGEPAVCLHTWGDYPFEVLGKGALWGHSQGSALAKVYEGFWHVFPHDWLHICEATFDPPSEGPLGYRYSGADTGLDIERWVGTNADGLTLSAEQVTRRGAYSHVARLREAFGGKLMIFPNQEAPGTVFPALGWERQMTLAAENPDLVERFAQLDCRRFLERVKAAKAAGADGFIFSEGYGGALDLLSPELYERIFLRTKIQFYAAVKRMGLLPIGYFLGDVTRYLDLINQIAPGGVMIEESKKGFELDLVQIRKQLNPQIVLFGNLDSQLLLTGTPGQIRAEVQRQSRAREHGPFVFINGSPVCPNTPPENLHTYLQAARSCV